MNTYLLIHGAWHGAWCWHKIVPSLKKAGHRVLAIDLPSQGADKTPTSEIGPHTWADYVCDLIGTLNEPVILVGHSRGGIVLSQVAERIPDKIKTLVYLSAFMVPNGETMAGVSSLEVNSLSLATPGMKFNQKAGHVTVNDEAIEEAFYHLCSPEDVALAKSLLQPEPLIPLFTKIEITDENFGRVPRIYIELLQDRAVSLPLQRHLQEQLPCDKVISIDTDHSAFFSSPTELVTALLNVK